MRSWHPANDLRCVCVQIADSQLQSRAEVAEKRAADATAALREAERRMAAAEQERLASGE